MVISMPGFPHLASTEADHWPRYRLSRDNEAPSHHFAAVQQAMHVCCCAASSNDTKDCVRRVDCVICDRDCITCLPSGRAFKLHIPFGIPWSGCSLGPIPPSRCIGKSSIIDKHIVTRWSLVDDLAIVHVYRHQHSPATRRKGPEHRTFHENFWSCLSMQTPLTLNHRDTLRPSKW